jgi:hypothetical protein
VRVRRIDGALMSSLHAGAYIQHVVWTRSGIVVAAHSDVTMLELVGS